MASFISTLKELIHPRATDLVIPALLVVSAGTALHPRVQRLPSVVPWVRRLATLGTKPWLPGIFALLAATGSALVALLVQWPHPFVHDEFSYLLAADTFASGRLTNPTHPLWPHFEAFHVIHQPTYMSKYPPGQGLLLALGQVVGGDPVVGVWLGVALMCAAVCWMLQAWLPAHWALLGATLVLLRLGICSYWAQSYWGGALAATGGALLYGALPRMQRRRTVGRSVAMGLGVGILANTRPYEGLLVSLPAAVWLLVMLIRDGRGAVRALLPAAVILVVIGAGMLHYNRVVTGSPTTLPYQVHEAQYARAPPVLWGAPKASHPTRAQGRMANFDAWTMELYERHLTLSGFTSALVEKLFQTARTYLDLILTLPLLLVPLAWRRRRTRAALAVMACLGAGLLVVTAVMPHYVAPLTAVLFFLVVQGLRVLRRLRWRGHPVGATALAGILVLSVATFILRLPKSEMQQWGNVRARLLQRLDSDPDRHLVVVRYGPEHSAHLEWVYNRADIDHAKIVFARELDEESNRRLVEHFQGRRIWLMEMLNHEQEPVLKPYP
ncbi:MAG: hypothetical protein AB2A00_31730 [Myxococcota bacterium]